MSEIMSSGSSADIFEAALSLPPKDRAALADALICSLDAPMDAEIEADWAREIERRMAEFERDKSIAIPGEQVLAEMRAKWPS